jgi:hypothetical protein
MHDDYNNMVTQEEHEIARDLNEQCFCEEYKKKCIEGMTRG